MIKLVCDFCGETPQKAPYDVIPHRFESYGVAWAQQYAAPAPPRHICEDCLNYAKARLQS